MWDGIVGALASVIEFFYNWTGNFGVAVILFTVAVKVILLPLDLKSKNSTARMQALNPEIQRINEKYADDPEKKNKKITELYQKNNVSPLGGCLPLLITFPIIIIMFAALRKISAEYMFDYLKTLLINNNPGIEGVLDEIGAAIVSSGEFKKQTFQEILPLIFNNAGEIPKNLSKLTEVLSDVQLSTLTDAIKAVEFNQASTVAAEMGYKFLWIKNIWAPDSMLKTVLGTKASLFSEYANGWFILSVVSTAGQYLQTYLLTKDQKKSKKTSKDDPANSMNFMNKIFPLITLYICAVYNSAFAIYYTISSIVSILQSLITEYIKKTKAKKASQEGI